MKVEGKVASVPNRSHMKHIGMRIREARSRKRLGQQEIAEALGVTKQLVSHWENARSDLPIATAIKLAALLGVTVQELLVGGDKMGAREPIVSAGHVVPLATPSELLEIARGILALERLTTRRHTDAQCSSRALSFRVWDRAMVPNFEPGHLVTVDPEVLPEPGDAVAFALLGSSETLFRRYRPQAESRPAMPPLTLRADNDDFEPRLITPAHQPVFLGTLLEHVVLGSR